MKKTMFITSVIMVVVLAIALTTSSLAWFSAGGAQSVSTTEVQIHAVNAAAVGAGIQISPEAVGTTSSLFTTAEVTPQTLKSSSLSDLAAMCPVGLDRTAESISGPTFYLAVNNMRSAKITQEAISGTMQTIFSDDALGTPKAYVGGFALRNSGTDTNFLARCNISLAGSKPENADSNAQSTIWVAVFDVTAGEGHEVLVGLLGKNAATEVTTMTAAASVDNLAYRELAGNITDSNGVPTSKFVKSDYITLQPGEENPSTGAITINDVHKIEVYAWFDGDSLINITRDTIGTISVTFDKYVAPADPGNGD
jgi:hypothetical protein